MRLLLPPRLPPPAICRGYYILFVRQPILLLPVVLDIKINPLVLMIPATISCSTAFMLPVATPPNAIVFGSGYIRIKDMVRIGVVMNIIGLLLIVCLIYLTSSTIFDFDWNVFPDWIK